MSINSTTGIVDLANSAKGVYIIIYLINTDMPNASFEVVARDNASFSYLDTVLAQQE